MRPVLLLLTCAALALTACGGDDASDEKTPAAPKTAGADLAPIKTYLTDHSQRLAQDVATLKENAQQYHDLAAKSDFDTKKMLADNQAEVAELLGAAKKTYGEANPAYEEMEGVVAGVPSLADYDVIIDAGSDASDPESAVPFSIKTEDGKTYKQPGNLFFLVESSLYGTEPKWSTKADVDGDGKVEFGESLPDPRFYIRRTHGVRQAGQGARRGRPEVDAERAGRADRARRDDADDVRVLRGVEELALHRRRQGD